MSFKRNNMREHQLYVNVYINALANFEFKMRLISHNALIQKYQNYYYKYSF